MTKPGALTGIASPALEWLWWYLRDNPNPHVLDCGGARQSAVDAIFRRGGKLFVADLIRPILSEGECYWDRSQKTPVFRVEEFLRELPSVPRESLSAILAWHVLDLLPRDSLPQVIERLWSCLRVTGVLVVLLREPQLTMGADADWWLHSLDKLATSGEETKPFPYAAITNREIERLIPGGTLKTFLTRTGRREVVALKT